MYHIWRTVTPSDIIIETLSKPLVKPAEANNEAIEEDYMVIDEPGQEPVYHWMDPIKMFLKNQPSSDDNTKVECIVCKSRMYHLINLILF
jgi:hypothetical protein